MCSFDNKRFLLDDNISSLAYGHYSITNKISVEEVETPIQSLNLTQAQVVEKRLPGFAYKGQVRKPVLVSEKGELAAGIHEVVTIPVPVDLLAVPLVNTTLPTIETPLPNDSQDEIPKSPTRNDAHEVWTDESSMGSNEEDSIFDSDDEAEEVEARFDEAEVEESIVGAVKKSSRKRVSSEENLDAPLHKLKNY